MNPFKKSLFVALALLLGIECSQVKPKKLKAKLSRQQQNKVKKEVAQVFKTDDQKKVAKEVQDVNALAATPQEKKQVKVALQQEVIKETADIKADLIEAQENKPQYITYDQALDIIKSKKELSQMKRSSWTDSLIIKPFKKTYRLYLRISNQKEYAALLEKERKALEHTLNVQAHNNVMLLYVALDLEIKQAALNTEHMFKNNNFYNITTRAFEGGAIFSHDMLISDKLNMLFADLNILIIEQFDKISSHKSVVQSIWSMNQVIKQAQALIQTRKKNIPYNTLVVETLCQDAAKKNNQVLKENKKTYAQYTKDWISEPKNLVKVGIVMAAIGGLYMYGPAIPAWLKEYANSSIGSIKAGFAKGYNATISSVKNLWNRVHGNQELPDSKESRMDAQEQESETEDYFIKKGTSDAAKIEHKKELRALQAEAFFTDAFDQQYNEQQHNEGWEQFESQQGMAPHMAIPETNIEYENVGRIRLNPTSGQASYNTEAISEIIESLETKLVNTNNHVAEAKKNLQKAKTNRTKAINALNNAKTTKRLIEQKQQSNNIDQQTLKALKKELTETNEAIIKAEKVLEENDIQIARVESALKEVTATALETQSLIFEAKFAEQEQQSQIRLNPTSSQIEIDPDLIQGKINETKLVKKAYDRQIYEKKALIQSATKQIEDDTHNIKRFDEKVADNPFVQFNRDEKELYVYRRQYFQDQKKELEQELETLLKSKVPQVSRMEQFRQNFLSVFLNRS